MIGRSYSRFKSDKSYLGSHYEGLRYSFDDNGENSARRPY